MLATGSTWLTVAAREPGKQLCWEDSCEQKSSSLITRVCVWVKSVSVCESKNACECMRVCVCMNVNDCDSMWVCMRVLVCVRVSMCAVCHCVWMSEDFGSWFSSTTLWVLERAEVGRFGSKHPHLWTIPPAPGTLAYDEKITTPNSGHCIHL